MKGLIRRTNLEGTSTAGMLASEDFIMDPMVAPTLEKFLSEGGDTATAIQLLCRGYYGRAQICNLVTGWMADMDCKEEATHCIEETVASIMERIFDPDIADGIFGANGERGIEWMPRLVSHRRWRRVIYQLVKNFPQCLMLNLAVRLISDAGFQNEISDVNTATQQLEIFSRVFVAALKVLVERLPEGARSVSHATDELVRVICQSEHTYLYTMAILENISRNGEGMESAIAIRIMELVRACMPSNQHEVVAFRSAMIQSTDDPISSHAMSSLVSMMSRGQLNPADISLIYQQYIMPRPPPVLLIRDPMLLDLLYDSLFTCENHRLPEDVRDKFVFLVAYANTVTETAKNKQRVQSKVELDSTRAALDKAIEDTDGGAEDMARCLPELLSISRIPCVAAGLLHFVRTLLLSETRLGDPPPSAFVLIDHISSTHPNLQDKCFQVLCEVYDKVSCEGEVVEVTMCRQRVVLDRFVHLLSVGAALPVLDKITVMFNEGGIDASLVRYFVLEVLDIIAPPYSRNLLLMLLPLVADTEIIDQQMREKTPTAHDFIEVATKALQD